MKVCRLCRRFIKDGEEYDTRLPTSPTGPGGATLYLHKKCLQSSPSSGPAARRGEAAPTPRVGRS